MYKVVTICGSMRFYTEMLTAAKHLSKQSMIVLMPFVADYIGDPHKHDDAMGKMLDDMHKAKISMSDAIYVMDIGGYIGESTKHEIEYAAEIGKEIWFAE